MSDAGIPSGKQAETLGEWCGVSLRTAKNWLSGRSYPRGDGDVSLIVSDKTGRPWRWLLGFDREMEDEKARIESYVEAEIEKGCAEGKYVDLRKVPVEYRSKIRRFCILLANNHARTLRLCGLMRAGRISPHDLLAMI